MRTSSQNLQEQLIKNVSDLQRHASDPRLSIWVSASAGSGKTKVLADRVTRLLLADVHPQRLLCLTFTKAAAAEMSIRLMRRLSLWAICEEEMLDRALADLEGIDFDPALRDRARRLFARVLSCPGGMRIQTIHGFAQEILSRFPLEAGLAPHFAVIDEAEAKVLRQEAMDGLFEVASEGVDMSVSTALRNVIPLMAEDSLRDLLTQIMNKAPRLMAAMTYHGGFDLMLSAMRATLGLLPEDSVAAFEKSFVAEGCFARAALRGAAILLAEKGKKTFVPRGKKILAFLEATGAEERLALLDEYCAAFITKSGTIVAKVADADLLKSNPEIEDVLRSEAARILSFKERVEAITRAKETEAVLTLALFLSRAYSEAKSARAALDYDDLIQKTVQLLSRSDIAPWVLYKLDGGIDHLLVDESQDTNPSQWNVIKTLVDEYCAGEGGRSDRSRTLFVVGDEKQSIYSFQGADPDAFFDMREYFVGRFHAANMAFDKVPLTVSFRSAPAVLRAVDAVFENPAVRAGVSHDPVAHQAFRAQGAGRVEVWPLLVEAVSQSDEGEQETDEKKKNDPDDWVMPTSYEVVQNPTAELAKQIANQIHGWIKTSTPIYDRELNLFRPIHAGDVMVLVRKRDLFVDHLVRELKAFDLPVSGVDRMVLTSQIAVMDLLALLQFLLLPQDDLTLATVLRGPLFGGSEDDLMALAIGRKGALWEAVRAKGDHDRFGPWVVYLEKLLGFAAQGQPLSLLVHILNEGCPADPRSGRRALAARLGPDAEDPIDELLSAASDYVQRRTPSLQGFVHWMISSEAEIKRELEQSMGRVRITTVHASKGLEAPVVILPDTVSVPQKAKLDKLLWDEASHLPFYIPRETSNAFLSGLRERARTKQLEEYRRLLYVALTRAADRLIICGARGKKVNDFEESWYHLTYQALAAVHQPEVEGFGAPQESLILADYALDLTVEPVTFGGEHERADQSTLPSWLFSVPASEPVPPRPLVPSRPDEEDPPSVSPHDNRFARGLIIHRLLQSLPDLAPEKRVDAAYRFLSSPSHDLLPAKQERIANEVLRLLSDDCFAPLFANGSRAEVPIVGRFGARLVSGQVDRLALVGDEIWVVDYKTNRPPPRLEEEVPAAYHSQMEAYRHVLSQVYGGRKIRCFLLWTYAPQLMEILPKT